MQDSESSMRESMTPQDLIRERFTDGESDKIIDLLCKEGAIADEIYSAENLSDKNKSEIFYSVLNMISSGLVSAKDIPKLIRHVKFSKDANSSTTDNYRSSSGVEAKALMSWNNFEIVIYDKVLETDNDGNEVYNISHHFYHEVGHSLSELKCINLEDIKKIISDYDLDLETTFIQEINGNVGEERFIKERFSELVAFYMQSKETEDSQKRFCQLRLEAIPTAKEIINPEELKAAAQKSSDLFEKIDQAWPAIKKMLSRKNIGEGFETAEEQYSEEEIAENSKTNTSVRDSEAAEKTEFGSDENLQADYKETPSLAKKEKHSPGYLQVVGELISSFGDDLVFNT